jgi:GNAT superfamily N-acetyltransferase
MAGKEGNLTLLTKGRRFEIRSARIEDKGDILSVIASYPSAWDKRTAKRYYSDYFTGRCPHLKDDDVFVLVEKDKIIGVTGYSVDRYEAKNYWLGWFYIHKDYQGNGYGKGLLKYVVCVLKRKGVKRLFIDTSSNAFYRRALSLYLNNGFKKEAVIKDYYGRGENQIILSRMLV